MSEHEIRVTPYLGGKTDGPVCCLLEIGGARILLDCGCSIDFDAERLLEISNDLLAGGGVDAVVLRYVAFSSFFLYDRNYPMQLVTPTLLLIYDNTAL